jgi:hypothetical protein
MIPRKRPDKFWVILAGPTPTSFRARDRETLLPTLYQLQRTQPDVTLKWFERNRVWDSPDAASEALVAYKRRKSPPRTSEWRPGGAHKDPRQRFELSRDQKRARFKARRRWPDAGENQGPTGPAPRRPRGPVKPRRGPR